MEEQRQPRDGGFFPLGNNFWQIRSKHGRDKLFESAELLAEAAHEYFQWCQDNPWYKNEAIKSGDMAGQIIKVPHARPYSVQGFTRYVDASPNWFRNFKAALDEQKDADILEVIEKIESIIYQQKYEGGLVGSFNAMLVARDLGLKEPVDVTTKGEAINTLPPVINVYTPGTAIPEINEDLNNEEQ